MQKLWFLSLAVLAEAGALHTLAEPGSLEQRALAFAGVHALASALFAVFALSLMPLRYRRPLWSALLFPFSFSLFVPVLGPTCLAAGFYLALRLPRRNEVSVWHRTAVPDLPVSPLEVSSQPKYTQGGLVDVLRHAAAPDKRLHAIMAVRQLPDREAVPILRMALRDLADDVRLFAYSLLDRKESEISRIIDELRARLRREDDNAVVHARLAEQFWELSYLGLALGEVDRHTLEQAWTHAGEGLASPDEAAAMYFLRGRIALRQNNLPVAELCFAYALAAGMESADIAPYQAEVAYREGRFAEVPDLLQQIPESARSQAGLADVVAMWC